jgi:hypothetical protein
MKEKRVVFIDFFEGQETYELAPTFPDRTRLSVCCCGLFSGDRDRRAASGCGGDAFQDRKRGLG